MSSKSQNLSLADVFSSNSKWIFILLFWSPCFVYASIWDMLRDDLGSWTAAWKKVDFVIHGDVSSYHDFGQFHLNLHKRVWHSDTDRWDMTSIFVLVGRSSYSPSFLISSHVSSKVLFVCVAWWSLSASLPDFPPPADQLFMNWCTSHRPRFHSCCCSVSHSTSFPLNTVQSKFSFVLRPANVSGHRQISQRQKTPCNQTCDSDGPYRTCHRCHKCLPYFPRSCMAGEERHISQLPIAEILLMFMNCVLMTYRQWSSERVLHMNAFDDQLRSSCRLFPALCFSCLRAVEIPPSTRSFARRWSITRVAVIVIIIIVISLFVCFTNSSCCFGGESSICLEKEPWEVIILEQEFSSVKQVLFFLTIKSYAYTWNWMCVKNRETRNYQNNRCSRSHSASDRVLRSNSSSVSSLHCEPELIYSLKFKNMSFKVNKLKRIVKLQGQSVKRSECGFWWKRNL